MKEDKTIYIDEVWIFTNRKWLVLDNYGNELKEYQAALMATKIDKETVRFVLENALDIYLKRWFKGETIQITADEAKYLLGIHEEQER
ncbi:MAG: hypothetical protein ACTSRC_21875, partial [Candidatus Helarchaeota archaeon]